jgi:hypothetical protein
MYINMNLNQIINREIWSLNENEEEITQLIDIIDLDPDDIKYDKYKDILKTKYNIDYIRPEIRNKELIDFVSKIKYRKSGVTDKNLPIEIEVHPNEFNHIEIKTRHNGKLISRVMSTVNLKDKTIDINNALVYPMYRRKGVYSFIVNEVKNIANKYGLEFIERKDTGRSEDAINFWKNRLGEQINRLKSNKDMELKNIISDEISKLDENPDRLTINDPSRPDHGKEYKYNARQGKGHAYAFGYYNDEFLIDERAQHWMMGTNAQGEDLDRKDMKFPGRLWAEPKVISFWVYPTPNELRTIANDIKSKTGIDIWNDQWVVEVIDDPTLQQSLKTGTGGEAFREETKTSFVPVTQYQGSKQRSAAELAKPHEKSPMPPNWNYLYNKGFKKYAQESYNKYFTEPLNEDDNIIGDTFELKRFNDLNSFVARKRYAESTLPRISAGGSSRLVYDLGDNKVLKLAANKKGLAQNDVERSIGVDNYFNDSIVTKVFDAHPDDYWLVAEKANRINPSQFKQMTGVSPQEAGGFVTQRNDEINGRRVNYRLFSDEKYEELSENEFIHDLIELTSNYAMSTGDFSRISSYGVVNRPNGQQVVLLDYGLSEDVFNTHYSRKRHRFAEGVYDDIEELTNTIYDGIKDGGYAFNAEQPQTVGEDLKYNHATNASPESDKYEFGSEKISETISNQVFEYYHGSDHKFNRFTDEFVGGEKAVDAEGAGIYFTDSLDLASRFGKNIYKVKLTPNKLLDETSNDNISRDVLATLIKLADGWELKVQDWGDVEPEAAVELVIDDLFNYNETEKEIFQQIEADFYRYDSLNFVRNMVKIGYDGYFINGDEDTKIIVMFNPSKIEILNVEENIEEDGTDLYSNNDLVEREIRYMPNTERVKVKSKCVIGGNGDGTSTACNQGEIENLELEKLPENKSLNESRSANSIEYGCLMADFSHIKNWDEILNMIDKDDLYVVGNEFGKETDCHITILYGFHDDVSAEDVKNLLNNNIKFPIKVKLTGISVFNNPEFDVVKIDIESEDLVNLNTLVKKLPYTSDFPQYQPHITIAYVKPGMGSKYVGKFKKDLEHSTYKLFFCDVDENTTYWNANDFIQDGINETIDPKEALGSTSEALNTIINKKRDVGFMELSPVDLDRAERNGLGLIPVVQRNFGFKNKKYIVHRNSEKAEKLKKILDRNGGFLRNNNPTDVREIGNLLGYDKNSIEEFIKRKFE